MQLSFDQQNLIVDYMLGSVSPKAIFETYPEAFPDVEDNWDEYVKAIENYMDAVSGHLGS